MAKDCIQHRKAYASGFSAERRQSSTVRSCQVSEQIAGFGFGSGVSMDEAIDWAKRCPNPTDHEFALEIRPLMEMKDFGVELTPEVREQEARLRAEMAAKE